MINRENSLQLNLKKFILAWNAKWPMDKYIRNKYNILFGSPEHRALNFIDMSIELKEDWLLRNAEADNMHLTEADGLPNQTIDGELLSEIQEKKQVVRMTRKQLDQEFEELDINEFNKK
jgi:hypothetical protein